MGKRIPVSAVLIAKDEEKNLAKTLHSLKDFAEIVLVDGESTDRTVEVARGFGARVFVRPFDDFASQKNYAVSQAGCDWVFSIDADEAPDSRLIDSVREVTEGFSEFNGFYIRRRNFNFGKELHFAGQGHEEVRRFFRRGKAWFEQPIHEKLVVEGKIGRLSGELLHFSSSSVAEYLRKLDLYTDLEARWLIAKGFRPTGYHVALKPLLRFLYFYFIRLGFLDAWEGFLYHSFSSFYLSLKCARILEKYDPKKPTLPLRDL